jgi:hypothetical protein
MRWPLVNPWHTGTKVMRLGIFSPKATLLLVEPLTAAAYGAYCYTTPMDGPFWLPWTFPVWPQSFVYDQAFFEQMLVCGQAIPVLILLAFFTFNKLEWQASFEAFGEMAQQSPKPKRRWFACKSKAPMPELTFPVLAKQSTKAGPRAPALPRWQGASVALDLSAKQMAAASALYDKGAEAAYTGIRL